MKGGIASRHINFRVVRLSSSQLFLCTHSPYAVVLDARIVRDSMLHVALILIHSFIRLSAAAVIAQPMLFVRPTIRSFMQQVVPGVLLFYFNVALLLLCLGRPSLLVLLPLGCCT